MPQMLTAFSQSALDLKTLPDAALRGMIADLKSQLAFLSTLEQELIDRTKPKAQPVFVPSFQKATIKSALGGEWPLNEQYFATRETAEWVSKKFGTGEVVERAFGGDGGVFSASTKELHIRLSDGRLVNAGVLASYYVRNPEDRFPGYAEAQIREILEREKTHPIPQVFRFPKE